MKPKVSILLLTVAFLTSLVAAANFYVARGAERALRLSKEEELRKVQSANAALEAERDELAKAKQALEEQVTSLTDQAKAVAEDLAREKRAREALTKELAGLQKEATGLRTEKQAFTEDLAKAKQSYQALSNELTTLRQAKEALEKRVKEMLTSRAKEAEQIVVRPEKAPAPGLGAPPPQKALTPPGALGPALGSDRGAALPQGHLGKVLVVNREFDFVVVNLGSKDNIRPGSRLGIFQGDKQIVSAEVEKVYENMAAANLLEEEKKRVGEVREGDLVRLIS